MTKQDLFNNLKQKVLNNLKQLIIKQYLDEPYIKDMCIYECLDEEIIYMIDETTTEESQLQSIYNNNESLLKFTMMRANITNPQQLNNAHIGITTYLEALCARWWTKNASEIHRRTDSKTTKQQVKFIEGLK